MKESEDASSSVRRVRTLRLAFSWGFAESTLFFIVPDVLITRIALQGFYRRALLACVCALAGALIGGSTLWWLGDHGDGVDFLRILSYVPGIDREVIADTGLALHERGLLALFIGGFAGQPYKLFAVHAGAQGIPWGQFLLVSAVARFSRFILTGSAAWAIGRRFRSHPPRTLLRMHLLVWLALYAIYFGVTR